MNIKELKVYERSMLLGDIVWNIVNHWNYFQKDTIGKQLVRSTDSIAANISEGYGRFHFKETKDFCYYSRGSLYESLTWIEKVNKRKLISNDKYRELSNEIEVIGKMLNNYIKSIGIQFNSSPFSQSTND